MSRMQNREEKWLWKIKKCSFCRVCGTPEIVHDFIQKEMGLSVLDAGIPQFINGSPVDSHLNLLFREACFYTNGLRPRLGKRDDFLSRILLNVDPVGLPGYFFFHMINLHLIFRCIPIVGYYFFKQNIVSTI